MMLTHKFGQIDQPKQSRLNWLRFLEENPLKLNAMDHPSLQRILQTAGIPNLVTNK